MNTSGGFDSIIVRSVQDHFPADRVRRALRGRIADPGCLPAMNRQHRHPDLPVFQGKTVAFPVPERPPLFSGHSSLRLAFDSGTDDRLSGFCAFSNASIVTGFFPIKTGIFEKQRFKRRIFLTVDTISTAEFF